ncbi:hypothetical protein NIES2109_21440 [Nostoc sp. HK-01]|nr:hypothetical protein NIES2109_21440 [Nostoc sp. HK-01]
MSLSLISLVREVKTYFANKLKDEIAQFSATVLWYEGSRCDR